MGPAVGVVVVPEGFAPDGKTRIISLYYVNNEGFATWGLADTILSLTDYTQVPTTDNVGSTSTGSNSMGYLPSDSYTGPQSYIDPKAFYNGRTPMIPSPYLGDEPNPEYYKPLEGGNVLSDFNGLLNTQTLVGLGSDYEVANGCWNYSDGSSNLQWYLPAAGELAYMFVRCGIINRTLNFLNSNLLTYRHMWSCSEYDFNNVYIIDIINSDIYPYSKISTYDYFIQVRPFAII